jgi:GTP-sensing pleiotropic transcriptional regulator CodY
MPYDEHDESGQFKRKYTTEQVVGALEDQGGSSSTSEVADTLGCGRRLALLRLRELEDDNRVSARSVGNTYLWTYLGDGGD